jgi:hypothetical protein
VNSASAAASGIDRRGGGAHIPAPRCVIIPSRKMPGRKMNANISSLHFSAAHFSAFSCWSLLEMLLREQCPDIGCPFFFIGGTLFAGCES